MFAESLTCHQLKGSMLHSLYGSVQCCLCVYSVWSHVVCCVCVWSVDIESVELVNGQTYQLPVVAGETTMFYLNVSKHASVPSHAVFQVHSQWYQVKVSFYDDGSCSNVVPGRYSVGTNTGLQSLSADRDPFSWCLTPHTVHREPFKVLVIVLVYSNTGQ